MNTQFPHKLKTWLCSQPNCGEIHQSEKCEPDCLGCAYAAGAASKIQPNSFRVQPIAYSPDNNAVVAVIADNGKIYHNWDYYGGPPSKTAKLRQELNKLPHNQHTVWKDGIDIDECWPSCHRCQLETALAQSTEATNGTYVEFDKAVKYLRENGYGDWDGTANGQEITLTGAANMMRQYLRDALITAPLERAGARGTTAINDDPKFIEKMREFAKECLRRIKANPRVDGDELHTKETYADILILCAIAEAAGQAAPATKQVNEEQVRKTVRLEFLKEAERHVEHDQVRDRGRAVGGAAFAFVCRDTCYRCKIQRELYGERK